jgi:hypothetical protein
MKKPKLKQESEEYQKFEKLAKELFKVPKSEVDRRQAEYEKQKKAGKKKVTHA